MPWANHRTGAWLILTSPRELVASDLEDNFGHAETGTGRLLTNCHRHQFQGKGEGLGWGGSCVVYHLRICDLFFDLLLHVTTLTLVVLPVVVSLLHPRLQSD